jgi:hypothetical protein
VTAKKKSCIGYASDERVIFGNGGRIKISVEYKITQQVIEGAFHQNNKIIYTAKIKSVNSTTGKTFEFTSTALNEIDARKNAADQALNFTQNAQ